MARFYQTLREFRGTATRGTAYSGLSLIELLVALAIGSVLSFAAVNLFLHSKISYLQDEAMARLQENGRYALRYLSHELTMAGYLGTLLGTEQIDPAHTGTACFNHLMDASLPLEHLDDVTDRGVPASGGTGVPSDCLLAGKHQPGTDVLLIRRTADAPARYRGERRGPIVADKLYLRRPDHGARPQLQRGGDSLNAQTDLWEYVPHILFVRNYSVTAGDGIPTLCRRRLARTSNRMAPTQCLVEGIENLQLEFGIDEDGDRRADRFESRPAPGDLKAAVVARIYVLVRSIHPVTAYVDNRAYTLGSTELAAANDGYYRRVLQATVLLRNTGAFSS